MPLHSPGRASAQWLALFIALVLPLLAHAEGGAGITVVDTEHIFGFTDGTDIGDKGDIELEGTVVGRFGKPGSYAALQNETAVRYGVTDTFRLAGGALFDYRNINNVPALDDYSGFNFAGLTGEANWQALKRTPVGLTLSASPQWRRLDDLSGQPADSYSVRLRLLADTVLIPATAFAAINLIATPTTTRGWQQEMPTEASAAIAHAIGRGVLLGAEVRHLTHNHDGFLTGHALFVGPSLFVRTSDSMAVKVAWSMQVPDECSGNVDLVNYERHQALLVLVKDF